MSEKVLKALMQMFAIIAWPKPNSSDRREAVKSFLAQQLTEESVEEYLKIFDENYIKYQKPKSGTQKLRKIGASSVKILKLCDELSPELTMKQKVIVLVQLFDFINYEGDDITEQEHEFVATVSEQFNIPDDEFKRIRGFVLYHFEQIPNSAKMLIIDGDTDYSHKKAKHIFRTKLEGQIRVFHAENANIYFLRYLGKEEVFINGQPIIQEKVYIISQGSSIRNPKINPIYFSEIIRAFSNYEKTEQIVLEALNLSYQFKNKIYGLYPLDITEESGNLVGVMGASGSGKTSLLNLLTGLYKPTTGTVKINGIDINQEPELIEGMIGYVSQDDLLIEELTVFENLYFNAKLCFKDLSNIEIEKRVNHTLESLGLNEIKKLKVGNPLNKKISGGQRKRLNIALELIREPSILFLDEPTSGLSSRDSENIMDLMKELSMKGKLIITVIHQPSSDIFKMFDKLIILDNGGYMIYYGDPVESIIHFKEISQLANKNESECRICGNVNPEQIFNIVEAKIIDEDGNFTQQRKVSAREWYNIQQAKSSNYQKKKQNLQLPNNIFHAPNAFKQFLVFTKRDLLSKVANKQYVLVNLLETPILAILLSFIIKFTPGNSSKGYIFMENSNLPVYIFMSIIIAIFIGLTVSAQEIIKDRKIRERESFLNLSRSSYLFSKIAILFSISAIQAAIYVILGNTILEIKGMYFQYWLMLFTAWCAANILGLNISDGFKTAITVYILIPFLIIPQIIFSGVLVKYDKLNPQISSPAKIPWYGEMITARWAYEGLAVEQFANNRYGKLFFEYDKALSKSDYKLNYWKNSLLEKIDKIDENIASGKDQNLVKCEIELLKNEIVKEVRLNPKVTFDISIFQNNNMKKSDLVKIRTFLSEVKLYYDALRKLASKEKSDAIKILNNKNEGGEFSFKQKYFNNSLSDFVRNSNESIRVFEYKNKLYQKYDPVFFNPENKFLKAHFYAPQKNIYNIQICTFYANILMIWFTSILLYIALYFRWLQKVLNFAENFRSKKTLTF